MIYFWYAERDIKSLTYPHKNRASGTVEVETPHVALAYAEDAAELALGYPDKLTVKQLNLIGN